jgi:TM2 domain-containing membrane protein YozV
MSTSGGATAYCTNCGEQVNPGAAACMQCGFAPRSQRNFCGSCGAAVRAGQAVCTTCGSAIRGGAGGSSGSTSPKSKVTAGVLAILLGGLGVHKFYLGRTSAGGLMLAGSLIGACLGPFLLLPYLLNVAVGVTALIEGIIYLTKSDEEFEDTYVAQGKDWF